MSLFPLPFTCAHEVYQVGAVDAHGNTTSTWAAPVVVACVWWSPSSTEPPSPPTGGQLVGVDAVLIVDEALSVDHRDRFVIDGQRFEVIGLPADYNHGPWATPGRLMINCKKVT